MRQNDPTIASSAAAGHAPVIGCASDKLAEVRHDGTANSDPEQIQRDQEHGVL
jgi:hypothetical protein